MGKEASRGNRGVFTDPPFPGISDTALQMMALATFPFLVTGKDPGEAQSGLWSTLSQTEDFTRAGKDTVSH